MGWTDRLPATREMENMGRESVKKDRENESVLERLEACKVGPEETMQDLLSRTRDRCYNT